MVKNYALNFSAFLKVTRRRQLQRTPAAEPDNEMLISGVACLNYTIIVEAIQMILAFVTVHNAPLITALVNSSLFIPLT